MAMRFSLFVHMERYDAAKPYGELYEELVELVQIAEAAGFETAWIGEHYGMEFTIAPNPFLFLANLAARTSTIRLATGNIVAPFWHPVRLASEAAMCDVITRGRLDLGIARGAYQFEFDRLMNGMPAVQGGDLMREMLPILRELWRGDYAHEGEHYRFPLTTSVPKPEQRELPIWVAARDPLSHMYAVEHGCHVSVTPLGKGDEEVWSLVERFDAACAAFPAIPRPQLMLLRHAYVVGSTSEKRAAAEAIRRFYAYFAGWFANDPARIKDGFCPPADDEALERNPDYRIENVEQNHLIGTPDEVIARLKAYEAAGVDQFSIWIDNTTDHAAKKAMLELWIREVLPAFAGNSSSTA